MFESKSGKARGYAAQAIKKAMDRAGLNDPNVVQGTALIDALGLRWNALAPRDLGAGLAIAALAMLGIFGVELMLGTIGTAAAPAAGAAQLGLQTAIKVAFTVKEELMMRALLLPGLLLVLRGRTALALGLSALAFGLIHLSNPGATVLSVLGTALGGIIYGLAFLLAGNLWLPIGLHFAWNFVQGPLLGFPVSGLAAGGLQQVLDIGPARLSGGAYGPEGGAVGFAFRFVVLAAVLLWLRSPWRGAQPAVQLA